MTPRRKHRAATQNAPVRQHRAQQAGNGQRRRASPAVAPSGPEGRHAWQRKRDYYLAEAQTALAAGDRVGAEYHLQHADHYLRMVQGTADPA